ncbi:VWA domain-containing protein [Bacillus aquiflavi]|uniref:VWA domain-containing protein n=1 Tax=Bacillus aquiflavi TaxID=2672567 RepID=A0A6B3VYW7_9BACI|nr:VWA domain-containing protein [Bacillus aquiflavi]MBA4536196.1 VWA domain-containing protein [Bacillus aquiflavi]NEY80564.1 VWA domain-containing protein [Bacillus aquiflavi]UAC49384.1 VWA domain-containing protein [Bacillus aquiflavi]
MALELNYPLVLLLLIPAGAVLFIFLKQQRSVAKKGEKIIIVTLRGIVFSLLIFALTVPHLVLPVKEKVVVFLVDRSASVKGLEEDVLNEIEKSIAEKDEQDSYAIVSFAGNATIEQTISSHNRAIQEFNGNVNEQETNIEEGLQFATSFIPKEASGRVVLFSDGNETSGNSKEIAKLLKQQNIELDYVPMKRPLSEDVAITELSVPSLLYEGEKAEISVKVNSNAEKEAEIHISVNNNQVISEKVHVKEGENAFTFKHVVAETGMLVYKGEVTADVDAYTENNILHTVANVEGTPKVLIVQEEKESQLVQILKASGVIVETVTANKLPTSLASFLQYDSIVFNNVSATFITEQQMKLIEQAVKEFGIGFVMLGGEESFGLGGYFKTPIEKLLPVNMDIKGKNEIPSLGLMIVLDRSGSMAGNKLALAKEAAARSVELLRENDTLGFIAFDSKPHVIVETKPLKNKEETIEKISSITPGGGTEIITSLEKAYKDLSKLPLQRKHIILLTDGQAGTHENFERLIVDGKENHITLSTVALGQDADRLLLESLAAQGTGRFYDVTDATVIPSILSRETVIAARTYIEDNPFYPNVQPYPEWLSLFQAGIPEMNAYIATTPKPKAQVQILSEKGDPILASWQYGLGATFAFTSDVSGKWTGDFASWSNWPQFVNKVVTSTLPKYDREPFHLSLKKQNGKTIIHLKSKNGEQLPIETAVVSQSGAVANSTTKVIAPGEYEIVLQNEPGMYFLQVKQPKQDGSFNVYQTGFTIPYSDEYLKKGINRHLLENIGNELKDVKESFRPLASRSSEKQEISQWLILAAFLCLFLEIVVRRFGLKPFFHLVEKWSQKRTIEIAVESLQKDKKRVKVSRPKEVLPTEEQKKDEAILEKTRLNEKQTDHLKEEYLQEERMKRLLNARKRRRR